MLASFFYDERLFWFEDLYPAITNILYIYINIHGVMV